MLKLQHWPINNKVDMIKNIVGVLYNLYNSNFKDILLKVNRNELISLYLTSQEHISADFLNYYRKAIINKYADQKR